MLWNDIIFMEKNFMIAKKMVIRIGFILLQQQKSQLLCEKNKMHVGFIFTWKESHLNFSVLARVITHPWFKRCDVNKLQGKFFGGKS